MDKFFKHIPILIIAFLLSSCGSDSILKLEENLEDEIHFGDEAFYLFDETSGAEITNSRFDDLHGTITLAQRVTGKINNALSFVDNSPSYVLFPSTESTALGPGVIITFPNDAISIEAWVKFVELDTNLTSDNLISKKSHFSGYSK